MQIVPLKIIKNAVMHFNQFRNTGCENCNCKCKGIEKVAKSF